MAMLDKVVAPESKLYPNTSRDDKAPRADISRRYLLPNRWKNNTFKIFIQKGWSFHLLQLKK
jgi:hypothetical protein